MRDLSTDIAKAPTRAAQGSSDFDLNPEPPVNTRRPLRPAGVLVGIDPNFRVLLTQRSAHLRHHPGQVAFPGGKVDPGDDGPIAAALREANEEVGLPKGSVDVLGVLPPHETVTGFSVTPVLARIPHFDPIPEPGEVDEVFFVPLDHFLDLCRFRVENRIWRRQRRFYYTVPFGPFYIWGATARMLRNLAEVLQ